MDHAVDFAPYLDGRTKPNPKQAAAWLEPESLAELGCLMAAAAELRQRHQSNKVELCAITNARSGLCSEDCAFCAQSAHHKTTASSYPLLKASEMQAQARLAAADGVQRFGIVTSGRSCPTGTDLDEIRRAIEAIRADGRIAPCASLGLLSPTQARCLADAGLSRYHHNLEAGPSYFPKICTSHSYKQRVETVYIAREAGLEICCGGIVGMGETPLQRAELAAAVAGLEPESIPLNFLSPIAGTPLERVKPITALQALASIAVFKMFAPTANIRTCGGRTRILGDLSPLQYLAGAGATMTGDYLTTSGARTADDIAVIEALNLEQVNLNLDL